MSVHLIREIQKLQKSVLSLGAMVEQSVHDSIEAVQQRDADLARGVVENDRRIDEYEIEV